MKQQAQARFIVSLLALMWLQGPLCALVCTAASAAMPTPAAHHSTPSEHPCGEQGGSPRGEPTSSHECTCSVAAEAVPSKAESTARTHSPAAVIAASAPLRPLLAPVGFAPSRQSTGRIPPPDILLLKSTLII